MTDDEFVKFLHSVYHHLTQESDVAAVCVCVWYKPGTDHGTSTNVACQFRAKQVNLGVWGLEISHACFEVS